MYAEEKISDGIYITKPIKKGEKSISNNMNIIPNNEFDLKTFVQTDLNLKVMARSNGELISIIENEFFLLEHETRSLFDANEEMMKFDPNDYDLIEAREENLVFINKKLLRMKELQSELSKFCPSNPICRINIYDFFSQKDSSKNEITSNLKINQSNNSEHKKNTPNNDLTLEIDL